MAPFHVLTAARIEEELSGKVVGIGGIWAQVDTRMCRDLDLTVVDLSPKMLEHWAAAGYRTIQGDARETPFDDDSIDLDWLKVPRGIYPVKPVLISATKP
jgi:hypothetical protein